MRPGRDKHWIITVTATIGAFFTLLGFFNYLIDPLWCFSHSIGWNNAQLSIDDRQQKTNFITFRKSRYNALILGSSRTTYINQRDFVGMKAFNYSVPSMKPTEYSDYIKFAKKSNGGDFEYIIIGMDFFGTNVNIKDTFEKPEHYFKTANSFLYRYRMLLSTDTLRRSFENIRQVYKRTVPTYDRANVRTPSPTTPEKQQKAISDQVNVYREEVYGQTYRYREEMKEVLTGIIKDNPRTKFIIFTTPVSKPLFCLMVEENRVKDYERWIRDLVDVFGDVCNFMYLNSITLRYKEHFLDAQHPFPKTATMIARRLSAHPDDRVLAGFGILVNRSTLEEHMDFLRANVKNCQ